MTDLNQNAGIALLEGQQLLGGGIEQKIKTTLGEVEIPSQARGLPFISDTLNAFGQQNVGKSAVAMRFGKNVVSGFMLVDNIGGGIVKDGGGISGCVRIDDDLDYVVKNNIMSTFANMSFPPGFQGGNCVNIFGGGDVVVKDNKLTGRDQGDCFGILVRSRVSPHRGHFLFERNLCTGADNNSGLSVGIRITPLNTSVDASHGLIGNPTFEVKDNIVYSQINADIGGDTAGIDFESAPNPGGFVKAKFIGNRVTLPVTITANPTTAGFKIIGMGPTPSYVSLHKNVSLTTPPVPGYRFINSGNPTFLELDMGYDNFGSSVGP